MVTASNGTAVFMGLQSGKSYFVDFYLADVVGTAVKFDSGSGSSATSLPFWKAPENCILVDVSIVSNNTVTTTLIMTADGQNIPAVRLRESVHYTTIATRPKLNIGIKAGTNFGLTEN
jgi:hypothetical protein